MTDPDRTGRQARCVLTGLVGLACVYTLHRAVVLRIEYYDGYDFLKNARALLHDPLAQYWLLRPPLVSLLQLPAVALGRASAPGAAVRLVAPHLTAALLAILTAGAVSWVLLRPVGPTLALLGTLLFVSTPYFIHYAPYVLGDLPSAGWAAAAVALYTSARTANGRASWVRHGACGLALGGAVLSNFRLGTLWFALAAAELWYGVRRRRADARGWLGLGLEGIVAVLLCLAVFAGIVFRLGHDPVPQGLRRVFAQFRPATLRIGADPEESWRDYLGMTLAMTSAPTLLLAGLGLGLALARRQDRDVPFLGWLAVVGGAVVVLIPHTEARYVLPALPAIIYFAVRGAEHLLRAAEAARTRSAGFRTAGVFLAVAALALVVRPGLEQALLDQDPVFRADLERRAAEMLVRARRPPGRLLWVGSWYPLHPRRVRFLPGDEYFELFHFPPWAVEYLMDQEVRFFVVAQRGAGPRALVSVLQDGDAVLRAVDVEYNWKTLPPDGVPPLELWRVDRVVLARVGDDYVSETEGGSVPRLRDAGGRLVGVEPVEGGPWTVFVSDGPGGRLRFLGESGFAPGEAVDLAGGELSRLVLLGVERTTVE